MATAWRNPGCLPMIPGCWPDPSAWNSPEVANPSSVAVVPVGHADNMRADDFTLAGFHVTSPDSCSTRRSLFLRAGKRCAGLSIASLLLCAAPAIVMAAPEQLECGDYMNDAAALKTAPHGAKRSSPRLLTVNYQGGTKRFTDQPPYQEAFAGAHWYYCGYVPALRAHLIGKNEDSLFSGVLLLDDTGQLIDAGQRVYPSPDGTWFLAERQESGEDGSRWRVAERSGKTRWDGYAGILRQVTEKPGSAPVDYVTASFENPHWTGSGLQATVVCGDQQVNGVASFVSVGGKWQWQADRECKPAP